MLRYHEIIRPVANDSFFEQTVDLWLGFSSGHMGPHMYQHHNGVRGEQPMSGVLTWEKHAELGTIPTQSRKIFAEKINDVSGAIDEKLPIVEFGPGSMEDANLLINSIESKEYIPVDCSLGILHQAHTLAASVNDCAIRPAVVDFFSEDNCSLVEDPAIGVLLGLTIDNIPGPVPKGLPQRELINAFRNLIKSIPAGGYLLVSTDICQDGEQNKELYNEPWHKLFGVNHIYRMSEELPMANFDPEGFEYFPVWHEHCSLLAHTVRATKDQTFGMGESGEIIVSVKAGDIFHYNNSFKYRPEFFEQCAEMAGLRLIEKWQGESTISLYLFSFDSQTGDYTRHVAPFASYSNSHLYEPGCANALANIQKKLRGY